MKKKVTKEQIEALLDPAAEEFHRRSQQLLAERIAYHEQKAREERELGR
jgi:hypothetical protein